MNNTDHFATGGDEGKASVYHPLSTLDSYKNSGNGYGTKDRERILPGKSMLQSFNGTSESTWQNDSMRNPHFQPVF